MQKRGEQGKDITNNVMRKSAAAPAAFESKSLDNLPRSELSLQRKCACGGSSSLGECKECKKKRLQTKLSIGASNDPLEREADRVADQVMAAPASAAVSTTPPRIQRYIGQTSGEAGTAPASVDRVLSGSGRPLDPVLQQDMGQRFGYDFSQVRVHSGAEAEQSARDVNALAYTVGNNIVFGSGQFASESRAGQRLIAHELVHVVQQNPNHSRMSTMLMRQSRQQPASPTFHQRLYVVRDASIGLGGGQLVTDLAAFKANVMQLNNRGSWTLVLAIHGSLDRIAAQAPPDWQKNAIFYTDADINSLFNGDSAWIQWRDTYGPDQLALVSCQVSAKFEGVMINNLTKHVTGIGPATLAPKQSARGMGTHCKPLSSAEVYEFPAGTSITTRRQYQRLSAGTQSDMVSVLSSLNSTYGYYGAPPVPDNQLLDYYFDVDPKGKWAKVTVGNDQNGNITDTDIPFWNRTTGPRSSDFRNLCDQGVGTLSRPHIPRGP